MNKSVAQALAFSHDLDEVTPTAEECREFINWHSQGAKLRPFGLAPGLARLVGGFKAMGMAMQEWPLGFRSGELFLADFLGADPIVADMAFQVYENMNGFVTPHQSDMMRLVKQEKLGLPNPTEVETKC